MATNDKPRKKKPTPIGKHRTRHVNSFIELVTNLETARGVSQEISKKLIEIKDVDKYAAVATVEEFTEFGRNYSEVTKTILDFESKYMELRAEIAAVKIPKKRDEPGEFEFHTNTYLLTSKITQLATQDLTPAMLKASSCMDIYVNLAERASKV